MLVIFSPCDDLNAISVPPSQVSTRGGGVDLDEGAFGYFESCVFERNSGGSGGAVSIGGSSTSILTACTFNDNSATVSMAHERR